MCREGVQWGFGMVEILNGFLKQAPDIIGKSSKPVGARLFNRPRVRHCRSLPISKCRRKSEAGGLRDDHRWPPWVIHLCEQSDDQRRSDPRGGAEGGGRR